MDKRSLKRKWQGMRVRRHIGGAVDRIDGKSKACKNDGRALAARGLKGYTGPVALYVTEALGHPPGHGLRFFSLLAHRRMVGIAAAFALLAVAPSRPAFAGGNAPPAPTFAIRGLDGRTVKLSDFKGKVVVLDFWATWCGPCRASLPHLNEVQGRFAGQGLVVVGISVDDTEPQVVRHFVDRLGLKFRMAMADERVLDLYGPIRTIPTTFFINRRGEVVRRVVGYIDSETLESYVQELF